MKKQIIILNGTGGSGKDTFINLCLKYASCMSISSVDKVYEVASLLGWTGTKTDKDRKFLADLKDLSTAYNDMPFEEIKKKIEGFEKSNYDVLFVKLREPEEIKRLALLYDVKTVLIKRKDHKIITSNRADAKVENYNYDYVIENNSLSKLDCIAKKLIDEVLK